MGPIFIAVDDRFKASVLIVGTMRRYPPDGPPKSIPLNLIPRSTVPVLMLNGRNDFTAPIETMIRPMFAFQGAQPEHKKLVVLDGCAHRSRAQGAGLAGSLSRPGRMI